MDVPDKSAPVIWLRQSARFTVGDQRRTIEIAIPVHLGASPQEIERLLREADAGMDALSRHLDTRIAAMTPGDPDAGAAASPATNGAASTTGREPAATSSRSSAADHAVAAGHDRPMPPAAPPRHEPAHRVASDPPTMPQPPAAAAVAGTQQSATKPAPTPAPAPAATVSPAKPLSLPEFLAQTSALGLTPPHVMQRLQVRSLSGLNLNEALDLLRRQMLETSGSVAPAAVSAPAHVSASVPNARPRTYFDEEDDYEVSFSETESDNDADTDNGHPDAADDPDVVDEFAMDVGAAAGEMAVANDVSESPDTSEFADLPDVPDLEDPASPSPVRRPATPNRPAAAKSPVERGDPVLPTAIQTRARVRGLLEQFRGIAMGAAAEPNQLKIFSNVIVSQLDAARADALVRGIWGMPPSRIGYDRLYALIQWGKEDGFAEEAPAMLAALKAERAQSSATATRSAPPKDAPHDSAPTDRASRPARAPRPGGGS